MSKIIVSVSNDLVSDQRVSKVCKTLHSNGHEIVLIGRLLHDRDELQRPYPFKRMRLFFNKGPLFYFELNLRLFIKILGLRVDILLANDLDTLLANYLASRIKRTKLVYDSHEYFTEVPELKNRFSRRIWLAVERTIFPRLKNVYTVGPALARIYSNKYNVRVNVIRNTPVKKEKRGTSKGYLFYQGAINKGRGLPQLIEAIEGTSYTLKIAGDGDIKKEIMDLIQKLDMTKQVELLGRLSPEILHRYTCGAAIGFNLLEQDSLNYYYSLANKTFDYIQAEVPQVSMNFPEYADLIKKYKVGELIDDLKKESILKAIKDIEENAERYVDDMKLASSELVWQTEAQKLTAIFANLD
ncbi:MAG: glycosyltransferase [Bacteroidota bacterium]